MDSDQQPVKVVGTSYRRPTSSATVNIAPSATSSIQGRPVNTATHTAAATAGQALVKRGSNLSGPEDTAPAGGLTQRVARGSPGLGGTGLTPVPTVSTPKVRDTTASPVVPAAISPIDPAVMADQIRTHSPHRHHSAGASPAVAAAAAPRSASGDPNAASIRTPVNSLITTPAHSVRGTPASPSIHHQRVARGGIGISIKFAGTPESAAQGGEARATLNTSVNNSKCESGRTSVSPVNIDDGRKSGLSIDVRPESTSELASGPTKASNAAVASTATTIMPIIERTAGRAPPQAHRPLVSGGVHSPPHPQTSHANTATSSALPVPLSESLQQPAHPTSGTSPSKTTVSPQVPVSNRNHDRKVYDTEDPDIVLVKGPVKRRDVQRRVADSCSSAASHQDASSRSPSQSQSESENNGARLNTVRGIDATANTITSSSTVAQSKPVANKNKNNVQNNKDSNDHPREGPTGSSQVVLDASDVNLGRLGKVKNEPRTKRQTGLPVPEGHVEVPLVEPRYERRTRTTNQISVSDYASDSNLGTISDMLHQTSVEQMSIRHGNSCYEGTVEFHTYSVFRHGARKIIAQSVGYASDGDLVMHRFDVGERSDSNNDSFANIKRHTTEIHDTVCLDYKARRPMTDGEEEYLRRTKQINKKKHRKYPGVKAPKNKKIRQRLMNDAVVATEDYKKALARAERRFAEERRARRGDISSSSGDSSSSDSDSVDENGHFRPKARGAFQNVPPRYHKLMHEDEEKQNAFLDKIGLGTPAAMNHTSSARATPSTAPADPNSAEGRFNLLNTRLREESKRALVSEYLTGLINELDQDFTDYIRFSVPMVAMQTPPFGPATPPFGGLLPPPAMTNFGRLPSPTTGNDFSFPTKVITDRSGFGSNSASATVGDAFRGFPSQPIRRQDTATTSATDESAVPTPTAPQPSSSVASGGGMYDGQPNPPSVTEIERVASALPDNAPPPLSYAFRDGYGRLICHAVAAYYKLVSTSEEDKSSGSRKTFVQFPESKRARAMAMVPPPIPFLQFLRMKTRNNSAGGGSTATPVPTMTPPMGPAAALGSPVPPMMTEDTAPPYVLDDEGQPLTKTAIRKLKKEQKDLERQARGETEAAVEEKRKPNGSHSRRRNADEREK